MPNRPAEYLLGPMFIGLCIELVLQGILSTQFIKYYGSHSDDSVSLKMGVAILALMTNLKTILTFDVVWEMLILEFGDLQAAPMMTGNAPARFKLNGVFVAIIAFYVQCYFCSRLHAISKWYIASPILALSTLGLAANIVATNYIFREQLQNVMHDIHLPLVMAADILLTTTTAYFLIRSKEYVLPCTTAAPATICALLNFVTSVAFPLVYPTARVDASTASNLSLPNFYAFSMMWTLNARNSIRAAGTASTSASLDFYTREGASRRSVPTDKERGPDACPSTISRMSSEVRTARFTDLVFLADLKAASTAQLVAHEIR
ncbi:hypothetical protein C8R44DRAFT_892319 [Mycena epipterygia]|nr:hypothetical protein C8R44DRAFT_892319 [Mycena epipterygia]